jgi:polyphosphate kinase
VDQNAPVAAPDATTPNAGAERSLNDPALFINRELSWLEFNERVLAEATGTRHPLLDRLKFLAIVATNLEEFFMIRVSTMMRKLRAGLDDVSPDGITTTDLLTRVRKLATDMLARQAACWNGQLKPLLKEHGIDVLDPTEYSPAIAEFLRTSFARDILPALTPLAFDPGHPFPFISNLSQNFAVVVRHGGRTKFARVKIPDALPRFLALPPALTPEGIRGYVYVEDVIRAHIQDLFPGTTVKGAHLFRVVRDADLVIQEDEADDLLTSIDEGLKQQRLGAVTMLQVEGTMPRRVLDILVENFEMDEANVYRLDVRVGFGDWMELGSLPRPELKHAPFLPTSVWPDDTPEEIFASIRERDRLTHLPFQSFSGVEAFVRAAVTDPHVIAIKMTLYRIGADSPLIELLIDAVEAGKQVAVLVELKARFDERNNIKWASRLEEAGAHVAYGLVNLKTHAKLCLIVRQEAEGLRRYVHVGTGNYNPQTSRIYTDVGLFTARPSIVEDVSDVFNYLTGYSSRREYRDSLVAPLSLRTGMMARIEREADEARAGRPARIILKLNSLTDPDIVKALYRASRAGVVMDLIVRGVCSLRPGLPGVSETITVRSIVGRFLEHSRIFWFNNGGSPEVLIGSADLMERNLDRRVEVLCPIHDRQIADHLKNFVLAACLRDTQGARLLRPDGSYVAVSAGDTDQAPLDCQELLLEWYAAEHRRLE